MAEKMSLLLAGTPGAIAFSKYRVPPSAGYMNIRASEIMAATGSPSTTTCLTGPSLKLPKLTHPTCPQSLACR